VRVAALLCVTGYRASLRSRFSGWLDAASRRGASPRRAGAVCRAVSGAKVRLCFTGSMRAAEQALRSHVPSARVTLTILMMTERFCGRMPAVAPRHDARIFALGEGTRRLGDGENETGEPEQNCVGAGACCAVSLPFSVCRVASCLRVQPAVLVLLSCARPFIYKRTLAYFSRLHSYTLGACGGNLLLCGMAQEKGLYLL